MLNASLLMAALLAVPCGQADPEIKDKKPLRGTIVRLDKEKDELTIKVKVKDEDVEKTYKLTQVVVTDADGKKVETKKATAEMRAGKPIVVPRLEKDRVEIIFRRE